MSNQNMPQTDERTQQAIPAEGDTEAYLYYAYFFSALSRAVKSLSGVPAWPEGTTTYYPNN